MRSSWPALLLLFPITFAHAEVEVTTYTQDQSCRRARNVVQESASRRQMLLWRGEGKDEFNLAYPDRCPLRGWFSAPFTVETQDEPACFVGYCCVATRGVSCR